MEIWLFAMLTLLCPVKLRRSNGPNYSWPGNQPMSCQQYCMVPCYCPPKKDESASVECNCRCSTCAGPRDCCKALCANCSEPQQPKVSQTFVIIPVPYPVEGRTEIITVPPQIIYQNVTIYVDRTTTPAPTPPPVKCVPKPRKKCYIVQRPQTICVQPPVERPSCVVAPPQQDDCYRQVYNPRCRRSREDCVQHVPAPCMPMEEEAPSRPGCTRSAPGPCIKKQVQVRTEHCIDQPKTTHPNDPGTVECDDDNEGRRRRYNRENVVESNERYNAESLRERDDLRYEGGDDWNLKYSQMFMKMRKTRPMTI